jgi:hypothetical protein
MRVPSSAARAHHARMVSVGCAHHQRTSASTRGSPRSASKSAAASATMPTPAMTAGWRHLRGAREEDDPEDEPTRYRDVEARIGGQADTMATRRPGAITPRALIAMRSPAVVTTR